MLKIFHFGYKKVLRPFIFKFDSETTHEFFVKSGIFITEKKILKSILNFFLGKKHKKLNKEISKISFPSPVGLSAGFDYNAELTGLVSSLGFGFTTIGTVTNLPYEGNPKPRLGRLVKSKALLVNKGFKSKGIDFVLESLKGKKFDIPTGISIGRSNRPEIDTIEKAVSDICESYKKTEQSGIPFSYYELNISCPNLLNKMSFYPRENLEFLLRSVCELNLTKPVFIKMPIEESNEDTLAMLEVINTFKIEGVVFGNLQKDRNHPTINQRELLKYPKGYASGFPTKERSTELIKLTKKNFNDRFIIIGTGGIFTPDDAKEKLEAGASLVQLITGLVFEGPQLVAQINKELNK